MSVARQKAQRSPSLSTTHARPPVKTLLTWARTQSQERVETGVAAVNPLLEVWGGEVGSHASRKPEECVSHPSAAIRSAQRDAVCQLAAASYIAAALLTDVLPFYGSALLLPEPPLLLLLPGSSV